MTDGAHRIAKWCAHATSVLWDAESQVLRDVASGKTLPVDLRRLTDVVERVDAHGDSYLILLRDDGAQLALARPGIAFPPSLRNTGPLPGLPAVLCWRDFASVSSQLEHAVFAHPDSEPSREVLDMMLYCIALVDGARDAGFDVGEEERRLERTLARIEQRAERS